MKKMHLLCNAHLDPVWLWRWNEGLAEAISTFRVAADFCEEFDNFVFNHNEALLYEWVEEHEPELFERIKKLVKAGKWKIMGGWYLQPDCVMTSGESLMEQIRIGQEYFKEKFGIVPTTAINFDPFGHSRGLVQILKKTGYDSYIFMRPSSFSGDFIWEGFDGSRILSHGIFGGYNTWRERALEKIEDYQEKESKDIGLCLWGVGNHGGGPSRLDLQAINEYMKTSEVEIVHSSAEEYFAELPEEYRNTLTVKSESLIPSMVGCYTSMVRIKQANRKLENKIAVAEKIMSYADLTTDFDFDEKELLKSKKALAFCQFHDVLPGSGIKAVENDSLRYFSYGEEIADKLTTKAFFKLCSGQKKAKDGEIPVMAFNPHPYEIEGEFEVGFMLQDQNWHSDEVTLAYVYDENGNRIPSQNEKPDCTFNLDWIEKVSFRAKLKPSSITRFDCKLEVVKKSEIEKTKCEDRFITVKNDRMTAKIDTETGLIALYEVEGKALIKNSGKIEVYKDNEDSWGMTVCSFKEYIGEFKLMSDEEANEFTGYIDEKTKNVRIVEDGDVRIKVQAYFSYKRSVAVVEYTIPKMGTYIDVDIRMFSNEVNNMIKYRLDTQIKGGRPWGETAFGCEGLYVDDEESVYHKWCGIKNENEGVYVLNNGTYGGSFTEDTIKISLLRTPVYSAHPIGERQIAPHDRFLDHIDMGERIFSYRITTGENIERQAQIFNEAPQLLSFFPSGDGEEKTSVVKIDNPDVILSSLRKTKDGYMITLHNFSDKENVAEINVLPLNKKLSLHFGKYELKTLTFSK